MTTVVVGTSIEHGTWLADPVTQAWPQRVAQRASIPILDRSLPGGCWTAANENGQTIRSMLDASLASDYPDIVIIGGPPNDFVRTSTTDEGNINWAVQNAISACQAAGVKRVILQSAFPFNDGGAFASGWWTRLEQMRTLYNNWVQLAGQNEGPLVKIVGDFGNLLENPLAGNTRADNRWYYDGLHLNTLGTAIVGAAWPTDMLQLS